MGYLLSDVVNEWLLGRKGESQNNLFARMFLIAQNGLREQHMDITGLVKIVELTVNDSQTVDLPTDFVQYSKIGICGCDGRIHSLGLDNDLCLNMSYNDCGVRIPHQNSSSCTCGGTCANTCSCGWWGGLGIYGAGITGLGLNGWGANGGGGRLFGLGGGNNVNGYFRYDRAQNQLLLANLCTNSDSIILEYISDLTQTAQGDFIVHPFEIQTIKEWMSWQYVADNTRVSLGEKANRERLYYNARRLMNKRYVSATINEWAEALRKSNTATVRF